MTEPSTQQSTPSSPPSSAAPADRPLWTLIGPGLGVVIAACQFTLLLGPLQSEVGNDLDLGNPFLVAMLAMQVAAAAVGLALGHRIGGRAPIAVIVPSLLLLLVGTIVAALSGASVMLIAASVITGFGFGAVLGVAVVLVGQTGERQRQLRLALALGVGGGLAVGLALGWSIAGMLGWRVTFLLSVPMILAAVVVTAVVAAVGSTRRA